jgi:Zn-dependent protease
MKIKILPQFWVFALIFSVLAGQTLGGMLLWIVILPLSVLVHEFGHALVIRLYNLRAFIELGMLGGSTRYYGGTLGLLAQFFVTLMGPLFGIGLAFFAGFLRELIPLEFVGARDSLELLAYVNVFWSIVNLVPVLPLDGGKILAIMCDTLFPKHGIRITYFLSGLFGLATAFVFFIYSQMFIGALFLLFAFDSLRVWSQVRKFSPSKEDESHLIEELEKAGDEWIKAHPEEAIARLEKLYATAKDSTIRQEARSNLCQYLILLGRPQKAYALLEECEKELSEDDLRMFQLAAYQTREYKKALAVGEEAFRQHKTADTALLNAFIAAHLGPVELVINWLESARAIGGIDMKKVAEAEELRGVREEASFQQFMKSL